MQTLLHFIERHIRQYLPPAQTRIYVNHIELRF